MYNCVNGYSEFHKRGDTMIKISNNGNTITVTLNGEIDHHRLITMRTAIDAQIEKSQPELLILDFSGVTFMDSSGIGLILGRKRLMDMLRGSVIIRNPTEYIGKLIKLAGLSSLVKNNEQLTKNG
jgi:stage II sporulation protein AA (anti-sigma F factor antagonist)